MKGKSGGEGRPPNIFHKSAPINQSIFICSNLFVSLSISLSHSRSLEIGRV